LNTKHNGDAETHGSIPIKVTNTGA